MINVRHGPGPADRPVEIVERKGLGHPDTLADALAERMSVAYSRHCLERFGAVLHHNLDKLYLRGGHCQIGRHGADLRVDQQPARTITATCCWSPPRTSGRSTEPSSTPAVSIPDNHRARTAQHVHRLITDTESSPKLVT